MLNIRSNIAFAILVVSRYTFNSIKAYYNTIKRIFRYLRAIIN